MRGYRVSVRDVTESVCALALQGPMSREILRQCCAADMDSMRFFDVEQTTIDNEPVQISRTGYTGDLGYELFMRHDSALSVWDTLMSVGEEFDILPAGLDALDMTRIEAGLILNGVDYFNAAHVLIPDRMSSPYELPLGWVVNLDRDPFVGQRALKAEKERGSQWATVGLDIDWSALEKLYNKFGLPPQVSNAAWRSSIPLYRADNPNTQIVQRYERRGITKTNTYFENLA